MTDFLQQILASNNFDYLAHHTVTGGDINRCFKVESGQGTFFLKVNDAARFPKMFENEAQSLHMMATNTSIKIPTVIAVGETGEIQYLLMEWLEKGHTSPSFWQELAQGLSLLHRSSNPNFGWPTANYIGSLTQQNYPATTWPEFYFTQRIQPLVKNLFDQSVLTAKELQLTELFGKNLPGIFPEEPPALVHGDLWAGNIMALPGGSPSIFDPACYYGHREMDIAMTLLFGGFDTAFYEAYQYAYPLEPQWRQRVPVAQLYPLLVHAVLFGGSYVGQCSQILKKWA